MSSVLTLGWALPQSAQTQLLPQDSHLQCDALTFSLFSMKTPLFSMKFSLFSANISPLLVMNRAEAPLAKARIQQTSKPPVARIAALLGEGPLYPLLRRKLVSPLVMHGNWCRGTVPAIINGSGVSLGLDPGLPLWDPLLLFT